VIKNVINKTKWSVKILIILLGIFISSRLFFNYGYTSAEMKKEYIIIEYQKNTFILLDKEKDKVITAPIDLNNPILKGSLKIIKFDIELDMYTIKLNNGLQLEKNERKEKYEKLLSDFNGKIERIGVFLQN
jgi:hypothetical protein